MRQNKIPDVLGLGGELPSKFLVEELVQERTQQLLHVRDGLASPEADLNGVLAVSVR